MLYPQLKLRAIAVLRFACNKRPRPCSGLGDHQLTLPLDAVGGKVRPLSSLVRWAISFRKSMSSVSIGGTVTNFCHKIDVDLLTVRDTKQSANAL